jgi:hypothetical protein
MVGMSSNMRCSYVESGVQGVFSSPFQPDLFSPAMPSLLFVSVANLLLWQQGCMLNDRKDDEGLLHVLL